MCALVDRRGPSRGDQRELVADERELLTNFNDGEQTERTLSTEGTNAWNVAGGFVGWLRFGLARYPLLRGLQESC